MSNILLQKIDIENNQIIETNVVIGGRNAVLRTSDILIKRTPNEHDAIEINGFMRYQDYQELIKICTPNTSLQILYGDKREPFTLFYGLLVSVETEAVHEEYQPTYRIQIKGMSYSYLLDCTPKCRAYMDTEITYKQLMQFILKDYQDSNFIIAREAADLTMNSFTVQYHETDWEFLRRMASREGEVLLSNSKTPGTKLKFGVVWGTDCYEISNAYDWRLIKKQEMILEQDVKYEDLYKKMDCYELVTEGPDAQSLFIGDKILIEGNVFYVLEATAIIKNHVLMHQYILASQKEFRKNKLHNSMLKGTSIQGVVAGVEENRIKIRTDMDMCPGENRCWFPYSTFYATFYCMPEIGDRINMYFPDYEESHAIILNSMHSPLGDFKNDKKLNFPQKELFANEDVKILSTKGGRMLILDDESGKVSLVYGDGSYISITEGEILLNTSKEIKINAGGSLNLRASNIIDFSANQEIHMTCGEGSVLITENRVDIKAADVSINDDTV